MVKLKSMKKLLSLICALILSLLLPACDKGDTLSVYAPDGAPALSLVKAIENSSGFDFNIVGADVIQTVVTGDKKADICILPVNLASKLIGSGSDYKMLGAITHGNFYFISNEDFQITRQTVGSLVGKTIGVVQLGSIAGLTLKATLQDLQVPYNELVGGAQKSQNKINLLPITPTEIGFLDVDLYLAPSPVVDVKAKALNYNFVGSLKSLYGESGFPQAIVVCKTAVLENNINAVKNLISNLDDVESYLLQKDKSSICTTISGCLESGLTPSFNQNNLSETSIKNSSIKFVPSKDCYEEVDEFITKIQSVSQGAVNTLEPEFYYLESL